MTNIVIFSGGRGSKSLIESLNKLNINKNISTIINLYDDGKSSGMVRSLFNMPGPSDARKVQEIFLKNNLLTQDYQKKLFEYRVSTTHLDFLRELNDFINKNSNNLFSIKIKNFKFRKSIKKYIKKFLFLLKNKFINTNDLSLINIQLSIL